MGSATASSTPRLVPRHIVTLCFAAVLVMLVSDWAKRELLDPVFPGVPTILLVTTLSLGLGQLGPVRRLEGAWEVGNLAFYLFFAAVGAMIHLLNALRLAPVLFVYVFVIITLHMLVVYGVGRLLRLDVAVITIASTAAKAGPPLVIPMAELQARKELALPGVVMGLLGYALGNYVGFAVAHVVRVLL